MKNDHSHKFNDGLDFQKIFYKDLFSIALLICDASIVLLSSFDEKGQHIICSNRKVPDLIEPHRSLDRLVYESKKIIILNEDDIEVDFFQMNPVIDRNKLKPKAYFGVPVFGVSGEIVYILSFYSHLEIKSDSKSISAAKTLAEVFSQKFLLQMKTRELSDLRERFDLALEASHFALFEWNVLTNKAYFSPKWLMMLGYSEKEVVFDIDFWRSLLHPQDLPRVLRAVQDFFSDTTKKYEVEYRLRKKNGSYISVSSHGISLRGEDGFPLKMVSWHEDLTAKGKEEAVLQEQYARLVKAEKMASLGMMAGSIVHEINNPITIILGFLRQLRVKAKEGIHTSGQFIELADKIENAVNRVSKVIKGVRNFTKSGEDDAFVVIKIRALIDETLDFCKVRFRNAGIELSVDEFDPMLTCQCKQVLLSQVLLNLLNNAFDAIENFSDPRWVRVKVERVDQKVVVRVIDSGKGISKEIQQKMLTPFFTTKGLGKGTGVGLRLSREIIESHKGRLYIDDTNPNTCFVFEIPMMQPKSIAKAA